MIPIGITELLNQSGFTEIMINRPQELFVKRPNGTEQLEMPELTLYKLRHLANILTTFNQKHISEKDPIHSVTLFKCFFKNVQTIDEEVNKKFLNGGQKQGAYTMIGDFKQNQQGIIFAEGFATTASVHEATGKPVVVAFDTDNLLLNWDTIWTQSKKSDNLDSKEKSLNNCLGF